MTIEKLVPGTTYVVRVQAQTVEGAGTYSMEYEFETLPAGKGTCRAGARVQGRIDARSAPQRTAVQYLSFRL